MKSFNRHIKILMQFLTVLLIVQILPNNMQAQDLHKLKDLEGRWKFSIGDNAYWADPNYNDSNWEIIRVPGAWEEQGFHGYDGYAWYRLKTNLPSSIKKADLYLKLGYIDDVDAVYINGIKIGQTGKFPPHFTTAYNANRNYLIPNEIVNNQREITIAIRVFDEGGEGGIIHGDISIQIDLESVATDLNLNGEWKFKTGNCSIDPSDLDFKNWDNIIVPGTWEDQGYKDYDGIACYVKEFELEGQFTNEHVIVLLGRIDDLDMVYLNGTLIGQSNEFNRETVERRSDMYKQPRAYHIYPGLLNDNGNNILTVKVYDHSGFGGIYEGSVGLISQENYIQYWRNKRNK